MWACLSLLQDLAVKPDSTSEMCDVCGVWMCMLGISWLLYYLLWCIAHTSVYSRSPCFWQAVFFFRDCPIWKDICLTRYFISAKFDASIVCIVLDNHKTLLWESCQTGVQWKFEERDWFGEELILLSCHPKIYAGITRTVPMVTFKKFIPMYKNV